MVGGKGLEPMTLSV